MSWDDVSLTGTPQLVVGLRDKRRRLTGYLVDVDADVHPQLRTVADAALTDVQSREPVGFTPYVDPEDGEYLTIDPSALERRPAKRRSRKDEAEQPSTAADEHAALVAMVAGSDFLEQIGAGQLVARDDDDFYLQAICLKSGDERIGFVTRTNPRQVLKRRRIWLGRNDDDDRLTRISAPELILDTDVHAVVTATEIAVLNRNAFQNMVTDTILIASHVPAQVAIIDKRFKARGVPLAASVRTALVDGAKASPRLAKRLSTFADRIDQIDAAAISSGTGFKASDLVKKDFVNAKGELECEPARIGDLLDALEGRFFGDPFSAEKRRADRFRRR